MSANGRSESEDRIESADTTREETLIERERSEG